MKKKKGVKRENVSDRKRYKLRLSTSKPHKMIGNEGYPAKRNSLNCSHNNSCLPSTCLSYHSHSFFPKPLNQAYLENFKTKRHKNITKKEIQPPSSSKMENGEGKELKICGFICRKKTKNFNREREATEIPKMLI